MTRANPSFYNLRFKPSQGGGPSEYQYKGKFHPNGGAEKFKTDRNPKNFNYGNLFTNHYYEYKLNTSDYFYQVIKRFGRSNDMWTKVLFLGVVGTGALFKYAFLFKFQFFFFTVMLYTRIRNKGMEPCIDEVQILDMIFEHPKLNKLFTVDTYHVIDYNQEFDKGLDNPFFPEYNSPVARFFNVDTNATTGYYKFGDLKSGATMTLKFKTMPYANNMVYMTEPFLIYDLEVEVSHNGEYFTERIIKAEEVLKNKSIFVIWN